MILVIADHNNNTLSLATRHVITAANRLHMPIHVLIAGYNCAAVITTAQECYGVTTVLVADNTVYAHNLAENLAKLIHRIADQYTYIIAPATCFGKDVLPRVAALLDVEQISDITDIVDANTFIRPIYAGNAYATVTTNANKIVITVRPASFELCDTQAACERRDLDIYISADKTLFVSANHTKLGSMPDLNSAKIVVAGGRWISSEDKFVLIQQLATQLNAAIGASRGAVDAGFVPNDLQVGQTGKVVAPDLYIAIGISGAIQHVAGMKDSKVIVAINRDPDAPIFDIADYGLVADLFAAIPELIASLSKAERFISSE